MKPKHANKMIQPGKNKCREALQVVLDQVDYIAGNCSVTEMVGAVLSKEVIARARQAIAEDGGTK